MKKLFYLFLVLPFIGFSQALSGTYVVGTSQTAPFNTLANAITKINAVGVSGPVVFLIDNNQTLGSTQLVINQLTGSTAANTFTIKPNTGKTITITGGASWSSTSVIKLNGTDNIIIDGSNTANGTTRDMTIKSTVSDGYNTERVIWVASSGSNGSTNNTIKNLIITGNDAGTTTVVKTGVSFTSGVSNNGEEQEDYETASSSDNKVINNQFLRLRYGINIKGNTSTYAKNMTITGNLFGSASNEIRTCGVRIQNGKDFTVSGNQFIAIGRTDNATHISGILIDGYTSGGKIFANKITSVVSSGGSGGRGICVQTETGSNNSLMIYNNFISGCITSNGNTDDYINSGYGIAVMTGKDVKIYFNTVVLNTANPGFSSAAYFATGVTSIYCNNNIFANTQNSGTRYAVFAGETTAFASIGNNDYYSTAANCARLGGTAMTFASWKSATGETTSKNVLPVFISSTDFHLNVTNASNLANLDAKGTAIGSITTDIDGDTRNGSTPDIGADEFGSVEVCGGGTTTFLNGTWSNGVPTSTMKAVISGSYDTSAKGNIIACELQITGDGVLKITSGNIVDIQHDLKNSGTLTIEDGGSLVQIDDAAATIGNITLKRKTTELKPLDYTYWCAPVAGVALTSTTNGTSTNYFSYSPTANYWVNHPGTAAMERGTGYIAMVPANLAFAPTASYTTSFTGVPNNGAFTVAITKATNSNTNLIGNPYPSALDADAFLKNTTNAGLISGTIYIWTHTTAAAATAQGGTSYTANDYAKYNLMGGTKAASAKVGGMMPTQYIGTGQGFFVEATTPGTNNLIFNNSMRVTAASDNGVFFRPSNTTETVASENGMIEKSRLWLSMSNDQGAYNEMLLGYAPGATNELDYGYDGKLVDAGNFIAFYSMLGEDRLSIQGRDANNFDENETIPLGFKSTVATTYTIHIENIDGFLDTHNIYLVDKSNDTVTNLKEGDYVFTTEAGTFDQRFELKYVNTTLSIPVLGKNDIGVIRNGSQIQVKSGTATISSVIVYDLLGKMVYQDNNISSQDFSTGNIDVRNQVVIVKVITEDKLEMVKKIMMN